MAGNTGSRERPRLEASIECSGGLHCRGEPVFYVFDLLWLDGEDLRSRPGVVATQLARREPSPALRLDIVALFNCPLF